MSGDEIIPLHLTKRNTELETILQGRINESILASLDFRF